MYWNSPGSQELASQTLYLYFLLLFKFVITIFCVQAFAAVQASVVHLQGVPLSKRFALVPLGPPCLTYSSTSKVSLLLLSPTYDIVRVGPHLITIARILSSLLCASKFMCITSYHCHIIHYKLNVNLLQTKCKSWEQDQKNASFSLASLQLFYDYRSFRDEIVNLILRDCLYQIQVSANLASLVTLLESWLCDLMSRIWIISVGCKFFQGFHYASKHFHAEHAKIRPWQ